MVEFYVELPIKLDRQIHGFILYIFTVLLLTQPHFSSKSTLKKNMHVDHTALLKPSV